VRPHTTSCCCLAPQPRSLLLHLTRPCYCCYCCLDQQVPLLLLSVWLVWVAAATSSCVPWGIPLHHESFSSPLGAPQMLLRVLLCWYSCL
jgi:hypothetical protein